MVRRSTVIAVLVLATLAPAAAQEVAGAGVVVSIGDLAIEEFARPRRMIYFFETEPDTLADFDRFLLYNSILTSASGASTSVVIVESPDHEVPVTQEGKEELARRVDANAWMSVYVAGGLDDLTVRARLYDMTAGVEVAAPVVRPGFPVTYRTLSRGFWDEIAVAIHDGFEPVVEASEATIVGLPGTTLTDLPGGPYTIGDDGRITILLPTPATYSIHGALAGFVPTAESFYLGHTPRTVELIQLPAYRFAVDLLASSFQFPGLRFRYHIVPGSWFVRTGVTTQYYSVNFVPNRPLFAAGRSLLSTIYLDGGTMLGDLDAFARYLVAGGPFLRVRHEPLGIERDAAVAGARLGLGAEIAPWRREPFLRSVRFFAEYQPTLFFAPDPDAFLARSLSWNAFPGGRVPLVYGLGWGVVDLRDLSIGVRFTW